MQRESPTRKITCPQCNGQGKTMFRWINANLRERVKFQVCTRCKGKREIEIPCAYQD